MSKFHSTINRREFIKALGVTGAGLGGIGLVAPVFHDMDELMSDSNSVRKLPWYIKEREFENPTVEIDWKLKQRYDARSAKGIPGEEAERRVQLQIQHIKQLWNVTGRSHKDYALMAGSRREGARLASQSLVTGDQYLHYTSSGTAKPGGYTYKDLGLPRWNASPEENFRMVTGALKFWGSGPVSVMEITENTKKIFRSFDGQGRPYLFQDVEQAFSDKTAACVVPNKAKYLISWVLPQTWVGKYSAPDGFGILNKVTMGLGYCMGDILQSRMTTFMGALGYMSISNACGCNNVGSGIISGNGEHGRVDYLISPEYGGHVRYTDFVVTDLPLTPTRPIDAGIWRFCQTCKVCAGICPSGAIGTGNEPSWEIVDPEYNTVGVKSYHVNYAECLPYRGAPGCIVPGGCGKCQSFCVFTKAEDSNIHDLVKIASANTGILNNFFRDMDGLFGYSVPKEPDDFWNKIANSKGVMHPWGKYNIGIK